MSRTINDSINQLKTSLSDIKTSLSNKNIEGGEQLKVSEIAGLIDQIEAGSGGADISTLGLENFAIVIAKGYVNNSDYYVEADFNNCKQGEVKLLENQILLNSMGNPNIYITMVEKRFGTVLLSEIGSDDYGKLYGTTGEIDISGGGIILVKMHEK